MAKVQKINNINVLPVPIQKIEPDKVKGYDISADIYSNIYLCAKKKSGKTSVIFNILKHCCNKMSTILVFCPTVNRDPTYIAMNEYFEKKKIGFICHTSIMDGKENNLENSLKVILKESDDEEEEVKEKPIVSVCRFDDDVEEVEPKEKKERKPQKIAPEYVFIFDDISDELKNKSLESLMKKNRHLKSKVIVSSQYMNDLAPAQRKQIGICILFKGHSLDKLQTIHKDLDLSLSFAEFKECYDVATSEPFSFLYIDVPNEEYRINFNHKFIF